MPIEERLNPTSRNRSLSNVLATSSGSDRYRNGPGGFRPPIPMFDP